MSSESVTAALSLPAAIKQVCVFNTEANMFPNFEEKVLPVIRAQLNVKDLNSQTIKIKVKNSDEAWSEEKSFIVKFIQPEVGDTERPISKFHLTISVRTTLIDRLSPKTKMAAEALEKQFNLRVTNEIRIAKLMGSYGVSQDDIQSTPLQTQEQKQHTDNFLALYSASHPGKLIDPQPEQHTSGSACLSSEKVVDSKKPQGRPIIAPKPTLSPERISQSKKK